MSGSPRLERSEDQRCGNCGVFDANEIAGEWLCEDCYVDAGACCAGSGSESED